MSLETFVSKLANFVESASRVDTLLYLRLVFKPFSELGYIHIASEREAAYIPVFRVENSVYIPITSVIGALRAVAEAIVKGSLDAISDPVDRILAEAHCELEKDIIRHVCSPRGSQFVDLVKGLVKQVRENESLYRYFATEESIRELEEILASVNKLESIPRSVEPMLACLCPICRLFGGPGIESKIVVLRVEPSIKGSHIVTRTAIDRRSSTVLLGHLFSLEYVVIDRLSINMVVKNLRPGTTEAKILATLLRYLSEVGISIGGHSSIGIGRFKLDLDESKGTYIELDKIVGKQLVEALTNIETLPLKPLTIILKELTS